MSNISSTSEVHPSDIEEINPNSIEPGQKRHKPKKVNLNTLKRDPKLRTPIWSQPINQQDDIRRAYINMKPYQPIPYEFPKSLFDGQYRRFQKRWYTKFTWLEYSVEHDASFCFSCYIFEREYSRHPLFTFDGFKNWRRVNNGDNCPFVVHVGKNKSPYRQAMQAWDQLQTTTCHIDKLLVSGSEEKKKKTRLRIKTSIESVRWLTLQTCPLRGNDESRGFDNRGNMIEMIEYVRTKNTDIDSVVLDKAPGNATYTSSTIQKEILHIFANMVRKSICDEIGVNGKFCILVDEAQDVSNKELMVLILRFIDRSGILRERFFDIMEVKNTIARTLKKKITTALERHSLNPDNMRGQGYDGANNMRGSFHGLQALFLKKSPQTYYMHYFAHRLQLALVPAAEKEATVWNFFSKLNVIVNLVGVSLKRRNELREAHAIETAHLIASGEITTGRGRNQCTSIQKPGKTRWSSNHFAISRLVSMYGSVIVVLDKIFKDKDATNILRGQASGSLKVMKSFDFVFILHLMNKIMALTHLLCKSLQEKSLDILNAMDNVLVTQDLLMKLRTNEVYDLHIFIVNTVCQEHGIIIPSMGDPHFDGTGRPCQQIDSITNGHHYKFDVYNVVIDFQMEEITNRFPDGTVELLKLSASLEPRDNFRRFQVDNVYTLAEKFYPRDFSEQDLIHLRVQLEHYKVDVVCDARFQNLSTTTELCQILFETDKSERYNLIDRLIRLVLTLPVSTVTAERAFSSMKRIKTALRNKMEEDYLADSMVINIE